MIPFETAFKGRRVLVTGHTGFKGGWLSLWLEELGAEVHGLALEPDSEPSLFRAVSLGESLHHAVQDIRDRERFIDRVKAIGPEIVFHLAAQPLVRRSYDEPLYTFETNILGTAYLLEACRLSPGTHAVVCVTTDKVYENREWVWPYRESDKLGGSDPYSASKASAELVAACYERSLLAADGTLALATARGGNVIGGGDWSEDRLVPDLVRAIASGERLIIRNPESVRPWQHVLSLCHGYLQLAAGLLSKPETFIGAWNFGPRSDETTTVRSLLQQFEKAWLLPEIVEQSADSKPESKRLALDSTKARSMLGWEPAWSLDKVVSETAAWYRAYYAAPSEALSLTRGQITAYRTAVAANREAVTC